MTPGAASMLLVAGIVGIMAFFTIAVAPTVFKVLPQEWASIYVRAFFLLHGTSVIINLAQMAVLLGVLWNEA